MADLLFDHEVGLGLEILRYNIGGSNTDLQAVNSLRAFAAVPSLLLPNGTYDWTLVSHCVLQRCPDAFLRLPSSCLLKYKNRYILDAVYVDTFIEQAS